MTVDKLNIHTINALPLPLMALFFGGDRWAIHDIDVETGVMRINVCGLLQVTHFGDLRKLIDGDHVEYDPDQFYIE